MFLSSLARLLDPEYHPFIFIHSSQEEGGDGSVFTYLLNSLNHASFLFFMKLNKPGSIIHLNLHNTARSQEGRYDVIYLISVSFVLMLRMVLALTLDFPS